MAFHRTPSPGDQIALFAGYSQAHGTEPWTFDGYRAALLRDLHPYGPGSEPYEFVLHDGDLYMAARPDYYFYRLGNLVRFDGDTGEASSVFIPPGRGKDYPDQLTDVDGTLYFAATPFGVDNLYRLNDATGRAEEVWSNTGTIAGMTAVGDDLYFVNQWDGGSRLMVLDGGSDRVDDLAGARRWDGVHGLTEINGDLYLGAGPRILRVDGQTQEVAAVRGPVLADGAGPAFVEGGDGGVYFSGITARRGHELFRLDPEDMDVRVYDLVRGRGGAAPDDLTLVDGELVFTADTAHHGRELAVLDEPAGRARVIDVNRGRGDSDPDGLLADGDVLYFTAFRPDVGRELFRYDGGRRADLVADLAPGPESSDAAPLGVVNGVLALSYRDAAGELSLASWDGRAITLHDEVDGLAPQPAFTVLDSGGEWMV